MHYRALFLLVGYITMEVSAEQKEETEMFGRHAVKHTSNYDKEGKIPVIRASICTGEKVAGFKDEATGKFDDLMLIKNDRDFKEFLREYGVEEHEVKREW